MPKPTAQSINKHAPSPANLEKEGSGSSSLGLETSPQRSRTCSLGKDKIEALKGLSTGYFVGGARSFCWAQKVNRRVQRVYLALSGNLAMQLARRIKQE